MEAIVETINSVAERLPFWLPTMLFLVASLWLLIKTRKISSLLMVVGFAFLLAADLGVRYAEYETFEYEQPVASESNVTFRTGTRMTLFYRTLNSIRAPGAIIASLGFLLFAFTFRDQRGNAPNKPFKPDTGSAGAA